MPTEQTPHATPLRRAFVNAVDAETGDRLLTGEEAAAVRGVKVTTWHRQVARGAYPPPDGHVGRTPVWRESTVRDDMETE